MAEEIRILVIEDSEDDFQLVKQHLEENGLPVRCRRVDSHDKLKELLHWESWDLVLADYSVPQLNFGECLQLILQSHPDLPVIMVTGTVGEEKAVEILHLGVQDFVLKDHLARLVPAIKRSLKDVEDRRVRRAAEKALQQSEERFQLAMQGANEGLWDWNVTRG